MWVISPSTKLSLTVVDGIANVLVKDQNWIGGEIVTFTALDEDGAASSIDVVFMQMSPLDSSWMTKPSIDFTAKKTVIAVGEQVQLQASLIGATKYIWTIDGAVPVNATVLDPVVTFSQPGYYSVKLVASNAYGIDSAIKVGYINVVGIKNNDTTVCIGSTISIGVNNPKLEKYMWSNGENTSSITEIITNVTIYFCDQCQRKAHVRSVFM